MALKAATVEARICIGRSVVRCGCVVVGNARRVASTIMLLAPLLLRVCDGS